VVLPQGLSEEGGKAYRRQHLLDHVDFSNPEILRTDLFHMKVLSYLQETPEQDAAGFSAAIDSVMLRAAASREVFDFCAGYLAEVFHIRGPREVVAHVERTYISRMRQVPERVQLVLKQLHALDPGSPLQEIVMPDTLGRNVALSQSLGSVGTLVFIWSSGCSHCVESAPKVHELFLKYRDAGLNVYAVGLEMEPLGWKQVIRTQHLSWTNVSDFKGFQSPVINQYGVRRTPHLVLLDHQGKVFATGILPEELETKLKELFGY
jgi:peroxiredoxin